MLSLHLSVCSFVRGGLLCIFWELGGSFLAVWYLSLHFGNSVVAWATFWGSGASSAPFWGLWWSLGLSFGPSGGPLGSILGALGVPWAPFWGLWGSLGLHFGSSGGLMGAFGGPRGRPWPPKRPKANVFQFFPSHFGVILIAFGSKKRSRPQYNF